MITTKRIEASSSSEAVGKTIKVSYKGQFVGLYEDHVKYTDVMKDLEAKASIDHLKKDFKIVVASSDQCGIINTWKGNHPRGLTR